MMIHKVFPITALLAAAFAAASCDRECLCHLHGSDAGMANVVTAVDWSGFGEEQPTGMTLYFENVTTGESDMWSTHNLSLMQGRLAAGTYNIWCINQSEYEFGGIQFEGMEKLETARAVGVKKTAPQWAQGYGALIAEPDFFASDALSTTIGPEMVSVNCKCHCDCCKPITVSAGTLRPENLIWTLDIEVEIGGQEYLSKTRGVIKGVSSGVSLIDRESLADASSQLLTEWKRTSTSVRCFGLSKDMALQLQFLLIDGKTVVQHDIAEFQSIVTDPILRRATLKVSIQEPLPQVRPQASGGFDADVDDWTEGGEIDLPI